MNSVTKLYLNDGIGNFTEATEMPFKGASSGSVAVEDVNGDGAQDLLIAGSDNDSSPSLSTTLYLNNGIGQFSETSGGDFDGISQGTVAFSDFDQDGDPDIFLSGRDIYGLLPIKQYRNDGEGNFTELHTDNLDASPFTGLQNNAAAFADIDGDGSEDLFIVGKTEDGEAASILYLNNGTGDFVNATRNQFEGLENSTVTFADFNNDGFDDLLTTGIDHLNLKATHLYFNDGSGNFKQALNDSFRDIDNGSIAVVDIDNDGDLDVFMAGRQDGGSYHYIRLYRNDGSGAFEQDSSSSYESMLGPAIACFDANGDGYQDLIATGWIFMDGESTKLYLNDGTGVFNLASDDVLGNSQFESVAYGVTKTGDIDNDGDEDILIVGERSGGGHANLYLNDGTGEFTPSDAILAGTMEGDAAFVDINNDDYLDIIITGYTFGDNVSTNVYINDKSGGFDILENTGLMSTGGSALAVVDVNGDGSKDLLLAGEESDEFNHCVLYLNDGDGNFTSSDFYSSWNFYKGSLAFSDVDNDGKQDIFIAGMYSEQYGRLSQLYRNTGAIISSVAPIVENNIRLTVFPNPTDGASISVAYEANQAGAVLIEIVDITGKLVAQQQKTVVKGAQSLSLNIETLVKGNYILRVTNEKQKMTTQFSIH